jgi:hypothetical protein
VEILQGLLLLKNIRRASGNDGTVKYEGPFLSGFTVEFDS